MERPSPLRLRRLRLGLSLYEVGNAIASDSSTLSLLERGLRGSADLEARLDAFLTAQERLQADGALKRVVG